MDYDLDNRIIKVDVDNNDVEKYRRLVGILDLESEANVARRVSSREADANQYRYDALGRRVIRQEGTTKTALIWWGNSEKHRRLVGVLDLMSGASEARRVKAREASLNQCAEHKHQAGQTVIQNDIMAHPSRLNSVIARAVDGSKFKLEWYHKNYLDHVYAVSDDDGDILEHYRYTAFGEVQIYNATGVQQATSQINNQILWNTRRRDELTGFYMYKMRHYIAPLGRWGSRDPIEEDGGANLYSFVGNSSLNRWDVLGLKLFNPFSVPDLLPPVNPKDGLSFWEGFNHFYNGGGATLDVPFSTVDPGWSMKDYIRGKTGCDHLSWLLSGGEKRNPNVTHGVYSSSEDVSGMRLYDLFQLTDIVNDKRGNAGPGVIEIQTNGSFNWDFPSIISTTKGIIKVEWWFGATLSANDNMFDFDAKAWGTRSKAKELITRGVLAFQDLGLGKDFLVRFPGSRTIGEYGSCCCDYSLYPFVKCK